MNIAVNLEVILHIDGRDETSLHKMSEATLENHLTVWKEKQIDIRADQDFTVIFKAYKPQDDLDADSHASLDDIKVLSGLCGEQKAPEKPTQPGKRIKTRPPPPRLSLLVILSSHCCVLFFPNFCAIYISMTLCSLKYAFSQGLLS